MTEKDHREAFGRLLAFVAAFFPSAAHIDAATIAAYYRVLRGVPLPVLQRVGQAIVEREPPYEHFPAAPVWLSLANEIAGGDDASRTKLLTDGRQAPYHCETCQDTGWQIRQGDTGRSYATACACRATNPRYQASRGPQRYRVPAARDTKKLQGADL
jgi:hypothetical protein